MANRLKEKGLSSFSCANYPLEHRAAIQWHPRFESLVIRKDFTATMIAHELSSPESREKYEGPMTEPLGGTYGAFGSTT